MYKIRNYLLKTFYKAIIKPLAFRQDPELIHDRFTRLGKFLGANPVTRWATKVKLGYSNPILKQEIHGIIFENPIGLAAGFDKNAELTQIIPSVGFGYEEIGSVTGEPCEGNPKPRLWRLKRSRALAVYYGLKNDGCETVVERLKNKKFKIPIGVSVAKTNSPEVVSVEEGVYDYIKAIKAFQEANIGDYFTINISCPNTYCGQPFTDAEALENLLNEVDKLDLTKPVFIKLAPDLGSDKIDELVDICCKHNVQGFVCANLTKNRDNPKLDPEDLKENPDFKGGISGVPAENLANELISQVYKRTKGKYTIIGCGGVFTAEDAYKKIQLGASLLQLITGMIYEGPQVVSEINLGLVKLLKRDGYKNISEAVGNAYI